MPEPLNVQLGLSRDQTGNGSAGRSPDPEISVVADDEVELRGKVSLYLTAVDDGPNGKAVTAWAHLSPEQAALLGAMLTQAALTAARLTPPPA